MVLSPVLWLVALTELWALGAMQLLLLGANRLLLTVYCATLVLPWFIGAQRFKGLSRLEQKVALMWVTGLLALGSVLYRCIVLYALGLTVETGDLILGYYAIQNMISNSIFGTVIWLCIGWEILECTLFRENLKLSNLKLSTLRNALNKLQYGYSKASKLNEYCVSLWYAGCSGIFLALMCVLAMSSKSLFLLILDLTMCVMLMLWISGRVFKGYNGRPKYNVIWTVLSRYFILWYSFHMVFLNMTKWAWEAIKQSPIIESNTSAFSFISSLVYCVFIIMALIGSTKALVRRRQ